ncbi:MAG: FG-GAP repeat protein [Spirochaetales bacterium]|nr:FG-GAP repeat protein [Spirochaetales bacterium]
MGRRIASGILLVAVFVVAVGLLVSCEHPILKQVEELVNKEKYGAPEAGFAASRTAGCVPLTVSFTDQSAGDAARPVTGWDWNFGDRSSSTEQNPTHTFTQQGRYTVSLTVTGPTGSDTETRTNYITLAIFDVNGDGYSDYIVGEPNYDVVSNEGRALVYSGYNGALLWEKVGEESPDYFGDAVGDAGDVNGDGYSDFIVGSYNHPAGSRKGMVKVFSGLDGSQLYRILGEDNSQSFGSSVSGAGDVNGDGYGDFVVGAPGYPNFTVGNRNGKFYLYSGFDGAPLYSAQGGTTSDSLGASVGRVGDINLDGRDEFIIGAPGANSGKGQARVYAFNGSFYYIMRTFNAPDTDNDQFGAAVDGCGDVDADGRPDVIIGDPYYGDTSWFGRVYVYRGHYWTLIDYVQGSVGGDQLGVSVGGADLNQDGYSDYMMGSEHFLGGTTPQYRGQVRIFSGKTESILYDIPGVNNGDRFGKAVSAGGDINRDGYPDFIVGAPGYSAGAWNGKVYVYSGQNGGEIAARSRTGSSADSFGGSVSNGQ